MELIQYIIVATSCLSVSYLIYLILFKNGTGFRQQRIFLIAALAFSLILPATGFRMDASSFFGSRAEQVATILQLKPSYEIQIANPAETQSFFGNIYHLINIYLAITSFFLLIIGLHIVRILLLRRLSRKTRSGNSIILTSKKIGSPFSFFRWIFIPENISDGEEKKSIIIHESIHVSQYHSMDNLLIELIAAAMWFNPLVWMMKKSLHLVHEYLADEGVLGTGIDKLRYQALLINQVTEERLICLSSSFNQSLIKKRMIMMTKSKSYGRNKFRILALVPLSAALLLIVALLNGFFPRKAQAGNTGMNMPLIAAGQSLTGSVMQDSTLKKKTYKVKVITHEQKSSNHRQVKVISHSNGPDTIIYHLKVNSDSNGKDTIVYVVGSGHGDVYSITADSMVYDKGKQQVIVTLKHPVKVEQEVEVEVEPVEGEHEVVVEPVEGEHEVVVEPVEGEHEQIVVEPGKLSFPDDVIYYIDGKKATKAEVDKIGTENIESISVYKGDGVKEAGVKEKGVGVIKITTKKP